jgi:hypothetical protein
MLPALRESSPSSKLLQMQDSTIWWTNTCPLRDRNATLWLHSSTMLGACLLQSQKVMFIAKAAPWAADEVMTLSPRDTGPAVCE